MTLTVPLPSLSVVIPAYNEAERIGPTLDAVLGWLACQPLQYELVVVDDGSEDQTRKVVRRRFDGEPHAWLIESKANHGKGHAVRVGMLAARGDLRLFMDADNSIPISQLPGLLALIRSGAHVAIGSRRAPGAATDVRPLYRRLWSRVANRVVQAGLLSGIGDTQCGFKLFTGAAATDVFSRLRTDGWGFDLEVLALAQRLAYPIAEHPVCWSDDPRSRINPLRDAWRITREFLRIRRAFREGAYGLPA
jgi:dolichyl-phosphate beta-glucosyltransferase